MNPAETHQRKLLDQIRAANRDHPMSQATENAYLSTPRHLFISRYRSLRSKDWCEVTSDNLASHLATIYADGPLILSGDDDGNIASTISQPSLVLRMLDMLQLEPGMKVFELGAGSGWNAALLGHIVGPAGQVCSLEIIPEIARAAAKAIDAIGIQNVSIIEADAGEGHQAGAPYDRAVFTAGTYDLPRHFHEQIRNGGLLLVVIKTEGGGDSLFLLRKVGDHFESLDSLQCAFVQMAGKYRIDSSEPICLEQLPEWNTLQQNELSKSAFWWGGKGKETFVWRTWGIRSFLGIAEPLFRAFKTNKEPHHPFEEHYFGLWDKQALSLVLAKDDALIAYSSSAAKERLLRDIEQWVSLGMPTTLSLTLRIYPADTRVIPGKNQWIIKRRESQFLWMLPA